MGKHIVKLVVPADGKAHVVGIPVGELRPMSTQLCGIKIADDKAMYGICFWAEADMDAPLTPARFRALVTGDEVPDGAQYIDTPQRSREGWIWHLYRLPLGEPFEPAHCEKHEGYVLGCDGCDDANG